MLNARVFVFCFAKANRHILVFVHVHNLSFHRHEEQNEEVHEQNGPEDWDIKDGEERHAHCRQGPSCTGQPKFELGQSPRKGSVFFSFLCRRR